MPRPVLVGFDLATQVGWCAGDGSRLPVVDSFRLSATGADVGTYLLEARGYFRILLDRFEPAAVIYEAPVTMPNQTPEVTTKLHALPGVLEMECVERGVPRFKVYPVTIKKCVTGSGDAPKALVLATAKAAGVSAKNKDEADAFGAWLHALRHYSPDLWPTWQGRLQGADID
jgi:Holliday junction resolvasome RuvABC endonuclease subunit